MNKKEVSFKLSSDVQKDAWGPAVPPAPPPNTPMDGDAPLQRISTSISDKLKAKKRRMSQNVNIIIRLQTAIAEDNVESMKELLLGFGDINCQVRTGKNGKTLLNIAIEKPAVKCVRQLLEQGADPNHYCNATDRVTPMHSVASVNTNQTEDILELLLSHGGNINNGAEKNGCSVLHAAVRNNNVAMVKYLLDHNVATTTSLHLAAELDHSKIAEMLLEADIGSMDREDGEIFTNVGTPIGPRCFTRSRTMEVDEVRVEGDKRETPLHVASKVHSARLALRGGTEESRMRLPANKGRADEFCKPVFCTLLCLSHHLFFCQYLFM